MSALYLYPFYHADILEIDMSGYERYPLYRFNIVSLPRTCPLVLYVPHFVSSICTTQHVNFFNHYDCLSPARLYSEKYLDIFDIRVDY